MAPLGVIVTTIPVLIVSVWPGFIVRVTPDGMVTGKFNE